MLTTLLLTIAYTGCPEKPEPPVQPKEIAVTQAILSQARMEVEQSFHEKPVKAVDPVKAFSFSVARNSTPSILRVSEETASDVPSGMAAIYLESNRPTLDAREVRTLDSMLTALRLSVDPQAVENLSGPPRAFKVSTVANEDAVDPKDEAQQSIYSSIQSTMLGI